MKFRQDVEQVKQDGETKREMISATTKAHDIEMATATKRHDTETRAVTAQNVEEIKAITALLLKHIDTRHLEAELAQRDKELEAKSAQTEAIEP